MRKKKRATYIGVDIRRTTQSWELWAGIAGVFLTLLWGCEGGTIKDSSVIHVIWWSTYGIQFLFVMIFCALPYAGSICEDIEYNYIKQSVIRGSLFRYCVGKIITIINTSIITMVTGMVLFVGVLLRRLPWIEIEDSVYQTAIRSGSFRWALQNEHYWLYIILFSAELGILTSMLSLSATYISTFISNKLIIFSTPIIVYYFITQSGNQLSGGSPWLDLNYIFSGTKNIADNDLMSFIYAICVGTIVNIFLFCLIYLRLKKKVFGD